MRVDRGALVLLALLATAAVAALLLRPVLVAPITGDDRYYYLSVGGDEDWTVLGQVAETPEIVRSRVESGRVNALTAVERKLAGRATIDAAVSLDRPIPWVLAWVKLLLAALSVLSLTALVASLRWRRGDGRLVRAGPRVLLLTTVAGALAFAAGAQPQITGTSGLNGWISYPVSTYTAAISVFGVTALVLWLARLCADIGRAPVRVAAALVLAALAVVTTFRYELVLPAVPLAAAALLVVPVTPTARRAEGRRAKALVALAYLGVFLPVFVAIRLYLRSACRDGGCYAGVDPELGTGVLHAFLVNVVSTVPGTGTRQVRALLERNGLDPSGAWTPTWWSLLLGLAVLLTLALAWYAARHRSATDRTDPAPDHGDDAARARLCLVGAGLVVLGSLGAAGVMSISSGSQAAMSQVGMLYRHSVLAWAGYSFALALLVVAVGLLRPRLAVAGWVALALLVGAGTAVLAPANERSLQADRLELAVTDAVNWQVVHGDLSPEGDRTRCRLYAETHSQLVRKVATQVTRGADRTFQRVWGEPFCSGAPGSKDAGR